MVANHKHLNDGGGLNKYPCLWCHMCACVQSVCGGGGGHEATDIYLATKRPRVTSDRSQLINILLHCSTSKPVLNVALSSPTGYRMSLRLVWVTSLSTVEPGYARMVHAVLVLTVHAKRVMRAVRCIPAPFVTGFEPPSTSHISPEEYRSTVDDGTCRGLPVVASCSRAPALPGPDSVCSAAPQSLHISKSALPCGFQLCHAQAWIGLECLGSGWSLHSGLSRGAWI